ncbi:MAG: preprotein translocase subunit SecE [Nitrospirota bacterium]|nr:preprotein translocase subunit SecE [Nitrospirota bacterium]
MVTAAQIKQYLDEIQTEIKKVVFPTQVEVKTATAVVMVTVIMISIFLGLVDRVLSKLVAMVLS